MRAMGAIVGTMSAVAAISGEFLSAVTAVSLGVTVVLALLLLVLAIGSWDELDAVNAIPSAQDEDRPSEVPIDMG